MWQMILRNCVTCWFRISPPYFIFPSLPSKKIFSCIIMMPMYHYLYFINNLIIHPEFLPVTVLQLESLYFFSRSVFFDLLSLSFSSYVNLLNLINVQLCWWAQNGETQDSGLCSLLSCKITQGDPCSSDVIDSILSDHERSTLSVVFKIFWK